MEPSKLSRYTAWLTSRTNGITPEWPLKWVVGSNTTFVLVGLGFG